MLNYSQKREVPYDSKENGFSKVVGEYIKTPKNAMVEKIYTKLGFTDLQNGRFEANVNEFEFNKTYINKK